SVRLPRRRDEHADGGRLAAPGTRSRAADVADRGLAEHEIAEGLLIPVFGGRRRQGAEETHVARVALEGRLGAPTGRDLVDHAQRVVAERDTDFDAFAAALAVHRIDEEAEPRRLVTVLRR